MKGKRLGVYNIGSTKTTRIVDMAHMVAEQCELLYGYKPPITVTGISGKASTLDYRIDKAIESGYIPKEQYAQEIIKTLQWCAERNKQQETAQSLS